ncbi:sugar ABC transporter permease [Paenibacillus marchantiophytorum]|uniref:Sugar ABC transporter permease n=1 Tax=Paenibacillus marchantiophytorum TaxID=1619310 RepID=A0ABQ1EX97_9BACL|nr:carbohydrate ABC transporter permease [Paenibacillus marchantiophytorum]GFZ91628.1 sugar ABC transporter permease [Paenibacillus marchantiophytorum]
MTRNAVFLNVKEILTWLLSLSVLIPVYLLIINSLKTSSEANTMNFKFPHIFQWSNYAEAIEKGNLVHSFFNSLLMSTVSAAISIIVTSMAAFILVRNKDKWNKFIYNYFFLGLVAPLNYVSTIKVLQMVHLQNTFTGIILIFATLGIPFAVFLYYGFIGSVPRELDEAAIIDGCGLGRLFFSVVFPLLKPVTITGFILNFLGAWNDFVTPLYLLNRQEKLGMINSIYNFFGVHFNDWNMIFTIIILTVLPVLILYILGQRYIITGMTSGSVKG